MDIEGTIPLQQQALALNAALQGVLNLTPIREGTDAHRHLQATISELNTLSPAWGRRQLHPAVQTLKDLVTAYHEAGHVLAYHMLTPRDRVRLDTVCFRESEEAGVEAGMTYTRVAEPWWPDPLRSDEILRELACIVAGKAAEPALEGGVELDGSDRDDQEEAAKLLKWLPEEQWPEALQQAFSLLDPLYMHPYLPRLAAHLYERWFRGDTVIPVSDLKPFLIPARNTR